MILWKCIFKAKEEKEKTQQRRSRPKTISKVVFELITFFLFCLILQGADPLPISATKTGRIHLKAKNTPFLPTWIGERKPNHIKFMSSSTLGPMWTPFIDDKFWTNSAVPLVNSLLFLVFYQLEHWMIYRGPGFLLAIVWFGSCPLPSFRQQIVSLCQCSCVSPFRVTDWRGGGGGGSGWGTRSYEGEKPGPL